MVENIWQKLKKQSIKSSMPFTVLAPMEDVTDTVFRQIILSVGRPDLFFTEFTNCDGLASVGRESVIQNLKYLKKEKPIIAQLWGNNPDNYTEGIETVINLGFDGIDINMGCPVKKIISNGSCGALIENRTLANEIIDYNNNVG
jgi:tRNA-dihydrouridine synthase